MDFPNKISDAQPLFMWCFFCWILLLSSFTTLCGKTDSFLLINHFRCDGFDVLFTMATYMAQSVFIFSVILFFVLNKQRRVAWTILVSFLGSGLICLLLKHGFDEMRPALYFEHTKLVMGVHWVPLSKHYSFPSGHSTTAFAIATVIAQTTVKKWTSFLCFFFACMVCYSRVYLGEHFVGDILVGSLLGGIFGYFCTLRKPNLVIASGFGIENLYRKSVMNDRIAH